MYLLLPTSPEAKMNLLACLAFYKNFRLGNTYSRIEIVKILEEFKNYAEDTPDSEEKNRYPLGVDNPKALVYEAMNVGQPFACPVFISTGWGLYQYVGPGYKANCLVINHKKSGKDSDKPLQLEVGEWKDGLFYVNDIDRFNIDDERLNSEEWNNPKLIDELANGITWWRLFEMDSSDFKQIIRTAKRPIL